MRRDVLLERFFTALISGQRSAARAIVDELLAAECSAEQIISRLFWPTLEQIQTLHRHDQLAALPHRYATRLLRHLTDQMQMRLEQQESNGKKVLVVCGPDEPEELGAQMFVDLLEAQGYDTYFAGGGVANDEIIAQIGEMNTDVLVVFGALPSTVPYTRLLIDQMHEMGLAPRTQVAVGGGVFNRAEGLAEEIGADLWATDPESMVRAIVEQPAKRMEDEQRTVGRKRRVKREAA